MPTIGWFDAFRENGDPTWFGDNRTPVIFDLQVFALASVFIAPLLAFLLILPGVRHYQFTSAITFLLSVTIGAVIVISIHYPCWHQGSVRIYSAYRAFTKEKMDAVLGVRIGLKHVNVTLTSASASSDAESDLHGLQYNERFELLNVFSMEAELEKSLQKGLPYPILKIIEYLSVDRAGFVWGRQYRLSGYYTMCLLWTAFAFWVVQMVILCLVPHYFASLALIVGVLVMLSDLVYYRTLPKNFQIRFPSPDGSISVLDFHLSICFYMTLAAGSASILFGVVLLCLQAKSFYTLHTFFSSSTDEDYCTMKKAFGATSTNYDTYLTDHKCSVTASFTERF